MDKTFLLEALNKCSMCGKCQYNCPVFQATQEETLVARGRIVLIKALLEGHITATKKFKTIVNSCMKCLRCKSICPSAIDYDYILEAIREELISQSFFAKISASAVSFILRHKRVYRFIVALARMFQRVFCRRVETTGVRHTLRRFKSSLLPELTKSPFLKKSKEVYTVDRPKERVLFFTGCAGNFLYPEMAQAFVELLNKSGREVMVPQDELCCGHPLLVMGNIEGYKRIAQKNVEIISSYKDIDAVISICPICIKNLSMDYPRLLEDTPEFAPKAVEFTQFIAERIEDFPLSTTSTKSTYHHPCYARWSLEVQDAPEEVLERVSIFAAHAGAEECCGQGGLYSIMHSDISDRIARKKAKNIEASTSEVVLTGCPGCVMQLEGALEKEKSGKPVQHIVQFLNDLCDYSSENDR